MVADMDLELFRASFARVSDAYGIETPGVPKAIRSPLTDELLRDHLMGKARVGAYTTDAEGLSDQIIIDIDIPKKKVDDPEEWERARLAAKSVLAVLRDLGVEGFITSSKSRGYHVRSLWEPSPAAILRQVGEYITKRAGVEAEVFPKQDRRAADGLGNFVWLPFHGESLKAGKTAILDGENGLDPMPDQWETLRDIGRNSHETLATVQAIVEEVEKVSGRIVPAVQEVRDKIIEGKRRDTLTSIAGTLRRRGLGEEEILPTLLAVNQKRCAPPVAEKDVAAIAKSITRYEPDEAMSLAAASVGENKSVPLFEPIEMLLANSTPQQWLIKGRLEIPSTVLCFGESTAGKSFVAVDAAANVASGGSWAGAKVSTEGAVFYIAEEGRRGIIRRNDGWQRDHGRTIPPGRLFISTSRIELSDVGGLTVEKEIERLAVANGNPKLVIVDTYSRALPPDAEENDAGDANAFLNIVDRLRDRFECVVMIVHHCGHDKEHARGSTALKAGVDAEFSVSKRNGVRSLKWTKMKDGEDSPPIEFALESVSLGQDLDGDEVSTAVVRWKSGTFQNVPPKTTQNEKMALETLRQAIEEANGLPVFVDA